MHKLHYCGYRLHFMSDISLENGIQTWSFRQIVFTFSTSMSADAAVRGSSRLTDHVYFYFPYSIRKCTDGKGFISFPKIWVSNGGHGVSWDLSARWEQHREVLIHFRQTNDIVALSFVVSLPSSGNQKSTIFTPWWLLSSELLRVLAYHCSQIAVKSTYDHQGVILKSALKGKCLRTAMGLPDWIWLGTGLFPNSFIDGIVCGLSFYRFISWSVWSDFRQKQRQVKHAVIVAGTSKADLGNNSPLRFNDSEWPHGILPQLRCWCLGEEWLRSTSTSHHSSPILSAVSIFSRKLFLINRLLRRATP